MFAGEGALQPQVGGQGDAAEMRGHVGHEFDGDTELRADFALVQVIRECVWHQVVT